MKTTLRNLNATASARYLLIVVLTLAFASGTLKADAQGIINSYPGALPGTLPTSGNYGVALDASGNAYVADYNNSKIYQITPAGVESTFSSGGLLNGPVGIAIDGSGNLYVTNDNIGTITKITPGKVQSPLGTVPGSSCIEGIAIDATGTNLYVSDYCALKIFKIAISGFTTTPIAGTGSAGTATSGNGTVATSAAIGTSGSGLEELAVDASNNVYFTDPGNHVVRMIAGTTAGGHTIGYIYAFAGTGASGNTGNTTAATSALLNTPTGVRVDASGNVYIADVVAHVIRVVNTSGIINAFAGTGSTGCNGGNTGLATSATFSAPYGLGFDVTGTTLFISDQQCTQIRYIAPPCSPGIPTAGTISGTSVVCRGQTGLVYSTTIANATTYNWVVPGTLGSIVGAATNNSITVNILAGAVPGNITVSATNNCGTGPSSSFTVLPTVTPNISGSHTITCLGSTTTLSAANTATATGSPVVTTSGNYSIYQFNSSGTFTPNFAGAVDFLVIGGGGSGSNGSTGHGGGGGAGGYRCSVPGEPSGGVAVTTESAYAVTAGTPVTVTVGAGGSANGNAGSPSSFGTIQATGGGTGAGYGFSSNPAPAPAAGACGGGGGQENGPGGAVTTSPIVMGYAGGSSTGHGGGGGGGAGAKGGDSYNTAISGENGGLGGSGIQSFITGTGVYRAGGGGGSTHEAGNTLGTGGIGGGGAGEYGPTLTAPVAGAANTGSGGGGGGQNISGAAGGSGVIIVRFSNPSGGTWASDNTPVATVNSSTGVVTAVSAGVANITYSYTPSGATCSVTSSNYAITVTSLTVSASATASVCTSGANSTLTLTPVTNAGAPTYSWKGPGGFTSTAQTPAFTPTTANAGFYTLTVTDGTCGTGLTAVTNSVGVGVVPTAGVISGPTVVCGGQTGVLYSTSIANASTYNWTVPSSLGTINGSSNGSSILVDILASPTAGNISATGTSGCGTSPSASISVIKGVAYTLSGPAAINCFGSTTTLSVVGAATGGNSVTAAGGYTIHSFTSSGTFTPQFTGTVQYLVVAGGGAGGSANSGNSGGGGAGGLLTSVPADSSGGANTPNAAYSVTAGTPIAVSVGAGGTNTAGASVHGNNGGNSSFGTITATGGGGGGPWIGSTYPAAAGGSGGGQGQCSGPYAGAAASPVGQGYAGGDILTGGNGGGTGGGGAGAKGGSNFNFGSAINGLEGGPGGRGITSSITGTLLFYAGGGGGASHDNGTRTLTSTPAAAYGGTGGGGHGRINNANIQAAATGGTANTGGGGGGGGTSGDAFATAAGAGGSGIVIVRYLSPSGTWASDNTNVATVNSSGVVTGVSAGIANITFGFTPSGSSCLLTSPNYAVTVTNSTSATATAGATTLCSSGNLTLTGSSNAGTGAIYTWSGPNNYSSTVQSPVITNPSPFVSSAYTLTVVKGLCGATATTAAVTVNGAVTTAGTIGGDVPLCSGITTAVYSTTIPNASTYSWTVPSTLGVISGSSTGSSINVTLAGTPSGVISVAGLSGGGCGTGPSSSVYVSSVSAGPAILGNTNLSCIGSTSQLSTFSGTGGTLTTSGGFRYHTYTSTGTSSFTPAVAGNVEVLVVAGGGGGAGQYDGGGGGAGGLIYNSSYAVSAAAVSITVGTGGTGGSSNHGGNGANSIFGTLNAIGGGGGGIQSSGSAQAGGSGGGAAQGQTTSALGTPGQGNNGGIGYPSGAGVYAGGGGGGAGAVGTNGALSLGGNGGAGLQYAQFASLGGSPAGWFAGGGGGSAYNNQSAIGLGGKGGGGNGSSNTAPVAGVANTGGGGGAAERYGTIIGAVGGSGIVIVRYPDYSGGTWSSNNTGVATVNSSTGIVTAAGNGSATISYIWSPSGGCTFTATTTVNVVPLAVTASASPSPVCTSGTLTLTGSPSGATGYLWSGPNGYSSSLQNPAAFTPTTAAAGTYTLTVTSGSCSSSNTTGAVVVTPTVTATGTITGSTIVCPSQTGLVYSTTIPNAVTYNWTVPSTLGTISGSSTGSSITVTIAASPVTGSISVAGVSANSCGTGPSSSITVMPGSAPVITGAQALTCIGSTSQLIANSGIVAATGGTVTVAGGFAIHVFTSNGTFTPTSNLSNVEYLVIGGGGAGGNGNPGNGGGGGAGGYRSSVNGEQTGGGGTNESSIASLPVSVPIAVTVGGGGATGGSYGTRGASGSSSSFGTYVTAAGGGGGGSYNSVSGNTGGSGGGGGQTGGSAAGGIAVTNPVQGFKGGDQGTNFVGGSGGGGAGSPGLSPTGSLGGGNVGQEGGNGGAGLQSFITGVGVWRGGGGGGSSHGAGVLGVPAASDSGIGGGGTGKYDVNGNSSNIIQPRNGRAGTGGGGGGGGEGSSSGLGGSGIVIVRYQSPITGTWTSSNTTVATVNSSTGLVTAHANGTSSITVTYTPANSSCQLSASVTVTVFSLTASASATTPVCTAGSNSTLTLTPTTNAGAPTYLWKGPGGFTSSAQTPTITPTTASAGFYTVTVTDGTCGTGVTTTTNAVVVNPSVTAFGTIAGPAIVCSNSTGLVYSTAPIANAISYIWTVPATATITGASNGNSITVDFSSAAAGFFTVKGVSAGGCDNGPTSLPFPVTVNTALAASAGITSPNGGASVCPSQTGVIYSAAPISGAASYVWTVPSSLGSIIGASTNNSITVDIAGVGVATSGNIKVAGVNLCGSTSINTASISVSVPATQVTGVTTLTCLNATTQLTAPPAVSATGGTITNSGGYTIHTFTTSGTFTPTTNVTVQYLVIAGGGGGGANGGAGNGGGGGAGGYRCSVPGETSGGGAVAESPLALTSGTPYTVTVGAGGPGCTVNTNTPSTSQDGQNSVFASITATGGGGGGSWYGAQSQVYNNGAAGGSGGGSAQGNNGGSGGTAATGQGTAGGSAGASPSNGGGAGGGGAGVAGHSPFNNPACGTCTTDLEGGPGGAGLTSSITGTAVTRAGGGGGASHGQGTLGTAGGACVGGSGGGGNGRYLTNGTGPNVFATAGAANTGSGGGAGGDDNTTSAGAGGSGIVIVRYATPATGTWSSDNTSIATVSSTGLVTAINAGTNGAPIVDTIRYTVNSGSCPYVAKIPITIAPIVTPAPRIAPPTCIGGTLALTDSGGNGTITYLWSGPNGFSSTAQSPSINPLTTLANGIYSLTVTKGVCTESASTPSVVVNANPVPAITESDNSGTTANDAKICNLDLVTLTATPATGLTYNWSSGLNPTAQVNTDNPSVTTTYTVTVTDVNGCTASASTLVTVNTLPPVAVNPPSAVCTGQTNVTLTASGATSYTWAPIANLTPTVGTSATETAQISQLTFYTVTGTDGNQCSSSVVVPVATVATGGTISPVYSIICSGGTKPLTVSGAAGHNYQWQISGDNTNWSDISGATNTAYTTNTTDGNVKRYYRLQAQSNSCWNVASTTAEVDVSQPTINVTTSALTDNSVTLNWTPIGSGNYTINYTGASTGTVLGTTPPKTLNGLTANGNYTITLNQTGAGLGTCPASGTATVTTLCPAPTAVTIISTGTNSITLTWTGGAGNYRVYYRPLYVNNGYFTKDVIGGTSTSLTKQGSNSLYHSLTYEIYVTKLDCPALGNVGQPSAKVYATTTPALACAAPVIDSVKSACPVQLEVFMHGSPTNQYFIDVERLTPTIQPVQSFPVTGSYFTANVSAGQNYLITARSRCGIAVSNLTLWPGALQVKPQCGTLTNLIISNPTCGGFTASWNADQCLANNASYYELYIRQVGTLNWNGYGVIIPTYPIGPYKLVNWLPRGKSYDVYAKAVYSCNGYLTYGATTQTTRITTLSAGCREEASNEEQLKPITQQTSADNSEVFTLYPNPNSGKFTVDLSRLNTNEDAVRIEVTNILGQTVITQLTSISDGHLTEFINMPLSTAAGTYIVRVTAGKNVYTTKMNISK